MRWNATVAEFVGEPRVSAHDGVTYPTLTGVTLVDVISGARSPLAVAGA